MEWDDIHAVTLSLLGSRSCLLGLFPPVNRRLCIINPFRLFNLTKTSTFFFLIFKVEVINDN